MKCQACGSELISLVPCECSDPYCQDVRLECAECQNALDLKD